MIGKTTIEVDANVMDPRMQTELMVRRCVLPAMRKAIDMVAEQVRENLMSHRSDRTGTRDKMSKKTREYHERIRDHLVEEVKTRVSYDRKTHTATGTVYFDKGSAWVANFLEYGHPLMRWGKGQHHLIDETLHLRKTFKFDKTFNIPLGRKSWGIRFRRRIRKQRTFKKDVTIRLLPNDVKPYPFMRPAYEQKREPALIKFQNELRKCFNTDRPKGPIRKTVVIGTVAGISAAIAFGMRRRGSPGNRPSTGDPVIVPFPVAPRQPMTPAAQRSAYYHTIAA